MEPHLEQRKSARFAVRGCTLISMGSDHSRLGEVLDISLGGIAFRCISGEEPSVDSGILNIFCNDGLRLANFPFRTIWDLKISDVLPFNSIITRRFGLKFKDLSETQMSKLCHLIQNYTDSDPEE